MRKGIEFETELNNLAKYLNSRGYHMHKNNALRNFQGAYIEGEPFDYEVIANGHVHCFDAKECSSKRWSLKNAKLNQLYNLLNCQNNGAQAYFLVWFKLTNSTVRFDADFVQKSIMDGKKSLIESEGKKWDWTELLT